MRDIPTVYTWFTALGGTCFSVEDSTGRASPYQWQWQVCQTKRGDLFVFDGYTTTQRGAVAALGGAGDKSSPPDAIDNVFREVFSK